MRKREVMLTRKTKETDISVSVNLDGTGKYKIDTPIGFLNHMLEIFCLQGLFDITIKAIDKQKFDEHHLVEDVGIILGDAFYQALGDKTGISRYGFFILPMDEVLATTAVDLSGRISFNFNCQFIREKVGDLPCELVYDFWNAFTQKTKCNLFVKIENGRNDHHKIEAIFKSTARSIQMACKFDRRVGNDISSTKGSL